ncbi:hypothetical protein HQ529_01260 [Candidatus Woesearchaeota archaeon]|nr:hypothetical protein [Candidatus Woesearchaeota archaeon]
MNTKRVFLLSMLIFVLLSFSVSADAQSAGRWIDDHVFRPVGERYDRDVGGFQSIPIYDEYYQIIDFGIFLILFIAISTISLGKAFAGEEWKDSRNAIKALAIIIGIAMAIAALKAGLSVTFFIPFVVNTIFFVCILVVYFVLLRMGMDKHKILAFLLAILITYLLFNFIGGAFESRGIDVGMPTWFSGKDKDTSGGEKEGFVDKIKGLFKKDDSSTSDEKEKGFFDKIKDFFKGIFDWFKGIWAWFLSLFASGEGDKDLPPVEELKEDSECLEYGKGKNEEWRCNQDVFDKDNCVSTKCYDTYSKKFCCKVEQAGTGEPSESVESLFLVKVVNEKGVAVTDAEVTLILLGDTMSKIIDPSWKTDKDGTANFDLQLYGKYRITAEKDENKGNISITHPSKKVYEIVLKKIVEEDVEPEDKTDDEKKDEQKKKPNWVFLIIVVVVIMALTAGSIYLDKKKGAKKGIKDRTKLISELGELLNKKKEKVDLLDKKAEEGFIKNAKL